MSAAAEIPTNADDFNARGLPYTQAFVILVEGCEVPPSFDVFQRELLELRNRNPGAITPQMAARYIADRYRRIPC